MSKNPLDFNELIFKKTKKYYNKINILRTILIVISVCFFYGNEISFVSDFRMEANAYDEIGKSNIMKEGNSDDWYFEKFKNSLEKKDQVLEKDAMVADLVNKELEKELVDMTKDYPIEEMAAFIAKYDRKIAGLIVGIAKKESNWGKRSPSRAGSTCYNYWGYKGAGSLGTAMGYGCFASPEEAVQAIGGRIEELVNQSLDTPSKIVVWKCGRSCAATGGQEAANKWISDVSVYYGKIVRS